MLKYYTVTAVIVYSISIFATFATILKLFVLYIATIILHLHRQMHIIYIQSYIIHTHEMSYIFWQ